MIITGSHEDDEDAEDVSKNEMCGVTVANDPTTPTHQHNVHMLPPVHIHRHNYSNTRTIDSSLVLEAFQTTLHRRMYSLQTTKAERQIDCSAFACTPSWRKDRQILHTQTVRFASLKTTIK